MGKIIKAESVIADMSHPVFIKNFQQTNEEEETSEETPQYDVADEFADKIFQVLSPEEHKEETSQAQINSSLSHGYEKNKAHGESGLSLESKQARALAAVESLKTKELELEALKQDLTNWENSLQQKEKELAAKENKMMEEILQRRKAAEEEASNTLRIAKEAAATTAQAAQTEAEAIRRTAQAEQTALREKAYNEGHKEGYAVGESKGIAAGEQSAAEEIKFDWNNLMKETEMLIKELQTSRIGILKSSEEEMLKLVIAFAKTIIKTEPLIQPEIILKNIDEAINKVAEVDKIIMRVNMRDKSMCQEHKDKFLTKLSSVSELSIVEDPNLAPGGIKIETGVGLIDASLEAQTRELEKALLSKYNRNKEDI